MKNTLLTIFLSMIFSFSGNIKAADIVTISGRQIFINGNLYLIKGICYNPVPKGSSERSWTTLTQDLALMNEAGINTIRVYSPITEEAVLDEIAEAGVKVIISFGYNQGGIYDIFSGTFIDYIETYKNHDAILFWEFGNEYNYHPEWFNDDINNWYTALNNAAIDAKAEDPNHPVATAHGEIPKSTTIGLCPDVQIWGMNVYRWDDPSNLFTEWESLSDLPMYLSEAGADRYMTSTQNGYNEGENEQMQADATENVLNSIFSNMDVCSGVAIFEFSDEWWKAGNPDVHDIGGSAPNSSGVPYDGAPNEEYWGILDVDRNKMAAFDVVKEKYNEVSTNLNNSAHLPPFSVFPNPSIGNIEIDLSIFQEENVEFKLIDIEGKVILSGSTNSDKLYVNDVEGGVYYLQVLVNNSRTTKTIIVN